MIKQGGKIIFIILLAIVLSFAGIACKSQDEIENMKSPQTNTAQEVVIKQELVKDKNVLSVTGTGKMDVDPDLATVQLSVIVNAATAEEAQLKNGELMAEVLNAVKRKGIKESNIKTQEITVIPQQDHSKNTAEVTGYSATNTISIRILDVKRTSEIINAAVQAGANVVLPLEFYLLDETAHYQKALAGAMEDALTKAEILAKAGNFKILGALNVIENLSSTSNTPDVLLYEGIVPGTSQSGGQKAADREGEKPDEKTGDGEDAAPMPLQAGQITVSAQVTVDFEYSWLPSNTPEPEK